MKSSELHRRFIKAGYKFDHAEGSHYFYIKDGVMTLCYGKDYNDYRKV